MGSWERLNEEPILNKEYYYSQLNKECITEEEHKHMQKVVKEFNIKNLGEYRDFYVQSDTTLLADVFEHFRNKCIEIYELYPAHFLSAPGLSWQAYLKNTGVKLELLTDSDMLMMSEERIRGGMCQAVYRYAKANNKYMNDYNKRKIESYLMYLDANNQYGWSIREKLAVDGFKWIEKDDLLKFDEIL